MSHQRFQDVYRLSPTQEGMLFHSLMKDAGAAYVEQIALDCRGRVDAVLLEQSFNALLERYDILRTVFQHEDLKHPLQIVLRRRLLKIYSRDISDMSPSAQTDFLKEFKLSVRRRGFDLSRDLLLKIALFKTGTTSYTLIWSSHHIMMDGWCAGVLFKDLFALYTALYNGVPHDLPPALPYKKYIQWLDRQNHEAAAEFWREYLSGYGQKTSFLLEGKSSNTGDFNQREYVWNASPVLSRALERTAADLQVTVNTIFQAVWGILLHNYNATTDAVFGSVVSGRPPDIPGIETMVGLFVNTVPMRVQTQEGQRFDQLVRILHQRTSAVKSYEFFSLAEIQAQTPLRENLFDHLVSFQNFPIQEEIKHFGTQTSPGFSIERVEVHEQTHYDLTVLVGLAGNLTVGFNYNTCLYSDAAIMELAAGLERLITQVVKDCQQLVQRLEIIGEAEKKRRLEDLNNHMPDFSAHQTISELFRQTSARYAEHPALWNGFSPDQSLESMNYRELEQASSRIAAFLQTRGVGPDCIVALRFRRSFEMVAAILGVLQAGGAYLPIDPSFPPQRALYMLRDSNTRLMLGGDDLDHREWTVAGQVETITFSRALASDGEAEVQPNGLAPGHLAYVIYTSGTTGRPKGSLVQHDNVVSLLFHRPFPFDFSHLDVWTLFHSYCFDFSVWEIFGALLYGGGLVIISTDATRDPGQFLEILERRRVTVLNQTPSSFYNIVAQSRQREDLNLQLRYIIFGGEALQPARLDYWRQRFPEIRFVNMYGITETTVHVTFKEILDEDILRNSPSIGKPLSTLNVLIAADNKRLLPSGVPGEILVSGAGVCRGYLNRPELTAEKFSGRPRLYRSGDRGRITATGELEYWGRIDQQVKIRGFRIEPKEIEAVLRRHPLVEDALIRVMDGQDDDRLLCAYVIPGEEMDGIRDFLSRSLPSYMLPSYFVPLATFPLTANGKLDLDALPDPLPRVDAGVKPFEDPMEIVIAGIFQALLGIDASAIGRDSGFFELGGHSLKAVSLANEIHRQMNVRLPIHTIFQSPTVSGLTAEIKKRERSRLEMIPRLEVREYYELSYTQKRMWVLQSRAPQSAAYNMPDQLLMAPPLDVELVKQAFRLLAERHEALRTCLKQVNGQWMQVVFPEVEIPLEHIDLADLSQEDLTSRLEEIWRVESETGFDLYRAPLLRTRVIETSGNDWYILFNVHHIMSDGWSMEVLKQDFLAIYQALKVGEEPRLETVEIQYKDYAQWHNRKLEDEDTLHQVLSFWRNHLSGQLPKLQLPYDFSPHRQTANYGGAFRLALSQEVTTRLNQLARDRSCSYFMVMVAAVNLLLSQLRHQDDILIGLPGAAREHPGLRRTVGLFVNTLVLRTRMDFDVSFLEFLEQVKRDTMKVLEYQGFPLELVVDHLNIEYPAFSVFFNMLNMADHTEGLDDFRSLHLDDVQDAKFDLEFYIKEYRNGTVIVCSYFRQLFLPETIEKITTRFATILERIAIDPTLPLNEYRGAQKKGKILKRRPLR